MRTKKILYVTHLWSAFKDLLNGENDVKGMPAFIYPLKFFIEKGLHVDIIAFGNTKELKRKVPPEWLKNSEITIVDFDYSTNLNKILSSFKAFIIILKKFSKNRYDFIYGHGYIGALGNIIALIFRVPAAVRLYGTFLYKEVQNKLPRWKIFLRHPLETLAFILPKKFLIITNDGTRGNLVKQHLGSNSYDFHFLLNGVKKDVDPEIVVSEQGKEYFIYPARISFWKRQDRAIRALANLPDEYKRPLIIYGQIYEEEYFKELLSLIDKLSLKNFVHFKPALSHAKLFREYKAATAVLCLNDVTNLTNVTIEALTNGGCVIALDHGEMSSIIKNGDNGFLISDEQQVAMIMKNLIKNKELEYNIKKNAYAFAQEYFKTWEERAELEYQILRRAMLK